MMFALDLEIRVVSAYAVWVCRGEEMRKLGHNFDF